jgi:hypothetical protein
VEDDNAKVSAQAVRKESKSASKLLLSKVGKTLMGRLSHCLNTAFVTEF